MAGLMPRGMDAPVAGKGAPAVARGAERPMPGQGRPPGAPEMEKPTAEEQEVYEHVVANAIRAIYSGETAEMVAALMEPGDGKYPVEELAKVVAPMMIGIEASGAAAGMPISREMTVQAALEIIEDIGANLLPAAGLDPLSEEHIEGAFLRTAQLIGADERSAQTRIQVQPDESPAPGPQGRGWLRRPMSQGAPK